MSGQTPTPTPPPAVAEIPVVTPGPIVTPGSSTILRTRWADVIDQVKRRNGLVASILSSAEPIALEESVLMVAFSTEFNRKTAEKSTNRQLIETAFERVYGAAYQLRCTVGTDENGGGSLLEDPVINFAQRTIFAVSSVRLAGSVRLTPQ